MKVWRLIFTAARKAARRFNAEYEATGNMGVFFHTTEREAAL